MIYFGSVLYLVRCIVILLPRILSGNKESVNIHSFVMNNTSCIFVFLLCRFISSCTRNI